MDPHKPRSSGALFRPQRGGLFIDRPDPKNHFFCSSAPKTFGAEEQKKWAAVAFPGYKQATPLGFGKSAVLAFLLLVGCCTATWTLSAEREGSLYSLPGELRQRAI